MSKFSLEATIEDPKYSLLPRKFFVAFSLSCANDVKHLFIDEYSIKCLEVTQLWLEGKVTDRNADCHRPTVTAARWADISASFTAVSNYWQSKYSYQAAYHAAMCFPNTEAKKEEYKQRFLAMVDALTKVEKVLYGIKF